ncbi:MAG: P-type DNA transfer ATPase VirB11 [Pseudomonadota bacterium]
MSLAALGTYLIPLDNIFEEDGVNEISVNVPGQVWVEKKGEMQLRNIPQIDYDHLMGLGRLVAQSTEQSVSSENPLLSATLPNGFRIQIVFPPACQKGNVVMSIRKASILNWDLDDYEKMGAFDEVSLEKKIDNSIAEFKQLIMDKRIKEFLSQAIIKKKNLIISGGTSTGKTTFANACFKSIPSSERLITCEDAREINLSNHPNVVNLLASKGGQGRAKVGMQDLIEACLRLRPDRIIVGELRGAEAFSFLRAINTGHPGSISTLHADTPEGAIEQLILMVMQSGLKLDRSQIYSYIINVVDIIIQLKRAPSGVRFISDIYFTSDANNM